MSGSTLAQPMRVSFVVPTYRRPDALRSTLATLLTLDFPPEDYEIVVVDDGSGDQTSDVVAQLVQPAPRLTYVVQENSGVATARNRGAAEATGDLLIFLDDDMLVQPGHIHAHLAARETHGECLVNGHWEFSSETRAALDQTPFGRYRVGLEDWVKTAVEKRPLDDGRMLASDVTAANLGISAERFAALGGFDEAFPFAGCEDQDFSYRAAEAGYKFIYDPAIQLEHNDERVTLPQFCGRQRRGAHTSVYLVALHPQAFSDSPLLLENAQITRFDSRPMRLKKLAKAVYSSPPGLAVAATLIRLFERFAPDSRALERLYKMTIGAYIFLGIRDGLAALPDARVAAHDAMHRRQQQTHA